MLLFFLFVNGHIVSQLRHHQCCFQKRQVKPGSLQKGYWPFQYSLAIPWQCSWLFSTATYHCLWNKKLPCPLTKQKTFRCTKKGNYTQQKNLDEMMLSGQYAALGNLPCPFSPMCLPAGCIKKSWSTLSLSPSPSSPPVNWCPYDGGEGNTVTGDPYNVQFWPCAERQGTAAGICLIVHS